MFELDRLLSEIKTTDSISLNGVSYIVKNCVAAASEEVLKMSLYILNNSGKLIKVSVESADLLEGTRYDQK